MNIKQSILKSFVIVMLIAIIHDMKAQTRTGDLSKTLKKELKFENWPGKKGEVRNGINPSKLEIAELSDAVEKKPKKLFYIAQTKTDSLFVQYSSRWFISDIDFMEMTLSYLNSADEAREYLMDYYIAGSSLPFDVLKKARDTPSKAGDVSFFNGQLFVRNNIVVKIHAEGKMRDRALNIAKKIDHSLLKQKTFKTSEKCKPKLKKDNNGNVFIEEP